jgi:hypothetical protein
MNGKIKKVNEKRFDDDYHLDIRFEKNNPTKTHITITEELYNILKLYPDSSLVFDNALMRIEIEIK